MIIIGIDRRPLSGIGCPYFGTVISQCDIIKNYDGNELKPLFYFSLSECVFVRVPTAR